MATRTSTETLWGGQRGALLPAERQLPGVRIVTGRGEHGVITHKPGYSIHWGSVPLDGGQTPIRLDNGITSSAPTPTLAAELRPPDPRRIEPGLPYLNTDARWTSAPDERMSAGQLYRALQSAGRSIQYSYDLNEKLRVRQAMASTLHVLLAWAEANQEHPEREEVDDAELARLKYEVYGAQTPFHEVDHQLVRALRVDWTRDYREGDGVAALDEETADYDSGWTLSQIHHAQGTLTRGRKRKRVPLWRLKVERPVSRPPLPTDRPARLDALLEDNLAQPFRFRYDGAGFARDVTREVRKVLAAILRTWLAEQGLDVAVTRQGDWYRIDGRRGALSSGEVRQLQALLPTARWSEEGASFRYEPELATLPDRRTMDLEIGGPHAERLSMMLSEALRDVGFRTSRTGEERRGEAARSCQSLAFDLPGHGAIRVECGDPEDPAAWHNLYIKDRRFAWAAGQWMKNKVPPYAVLEAVRQRGIRVFG